jgi:hypothetical protein
MSATRLHGKQDKPEGSTHVKNEKETKNKQTEKNLTNPGYTGFLLKISSFFSKFEKMLAWQKNFGTHTPNTQKRQAEPKQKNQACIGLNSGTSPESSPCKIKAKQSKQVENNKRYRIAYMLRV